MSPNKDEKTHTHIPQPPPPKHQPTNKKTQETLHPAMLAFTATLKVFFNEQINSLYFPFFECTCVEFWSNKRSL
jgi:hypothetical protein